ncbi:MAG TPA: DUF4421 family protein [Cyclobacteriaceae bacterium]|nr:DUF4421 family protein [Cyclobacteriaceae bacterium]
MDARKAWLAALIVSLFFFKSFSQTIDVAIKPLEDADSLYIRGFSRKNDVRIFYGGQGNRLVLGSLRDGSPDLAKSIYNNTNDFLGVGLTYGWLDGDLSFSLPGTTYLNEERSNLDQFKLSGSYTRRKIAYRAYMADSKGMVISGNNDEYESTPSLHELRVGLQATYIFNEQQYSYRAALYQGEIQMNTAGSFLLRIEPFYRSLGKSGEPMVPEPYDTEARFGEQVGLTYARAPGFIIMPGYGVNFVFNDSKMFISPLLLAGAGAAFNNFEGANGTGTHFNMEYQAYFLLNAGYNGSMFYSRVQFTYAAGYSVIQPAYLTSTDLIVSVLAGFRFKNIKH